jgi:hypothetical protein
MKGTLAASTFRAELFQALESAHRGEEVIVTYKGDEYALTMKRKPSKFAHVTQRPDAVLDWDALAEASSWDEESWKAKWDKRLHSKASHADRGR